MKVVDKDSVILKTKKQKQNDLKAIKMQLGTINCFFFPQIK